MTFTDQITLAAGCLTLALAVPVALADSPHFTRASGSLNTNGSLTVSFKEAGLGTNQLINYALTADATATYVCVNRGGPTRARRTRRRTTQDYQGHLQGAVFSGGRAAAEVLAALK